MYMSTVLRISTICLKKMKITSLKKINSPKLSGYKVKKDKFVQRASFAFFHLVIKAPSSGQELITRSLQRLSLSLLRYPSLSSSMLKRAFPPTIVPLSQSMHNVPRFTSHA